MTDGDRVALAAECRRLVDEFDKATARMTFNPTAENCAAAIAAENALHAAIDALAAAPAQPTLTSDLLWNSDEVMAVNAELGLPMWQIEKLGRAILAALHRERVSRTRRTT